VLGGVSNFLHFLHFLHFRLKKRVLEKSTVFLPAKKKYFSSQIIIGEIDLALSVGWKLCFQFLTFLTFQTWKEGFRKINSFSPRIKKMFLQPNKHRREIFYDVRRLELVLGGVFSEQTHLMVTQSVLVVMKSF
jgi:hypothetical protein